MGDLNQSDFIEKNKLLIQSPVLEVGSKDYGNTPDYRMILPEADYVGIDMEEGKGVDLVLDLTREFAEIDARLSGKRFNTLICMSVLEHVKNPFKACESMARLMNPDGVIFVSVPFSWRIHGYPSDYWRFTPEGVKTLFPDFDFGVHDGSLTTSVIGEMSPIHNHMMRVELDVEQGLTRRVGRRAGPLILKLLKGLGLAPRVLRRYPYLFPPVMVNMIGIKKRR